MNNDTCTDNDIMLVFGRNESGGFTYVPDYYTRKGCEDADELYWNVKGPVTWHPNGEVWWAGDLDELLQYVVDSNNREAEHYLRVVLHDMGKGEDPGCYVSEEAAFNYFQENGHLEAAEAAFGGDDDDHYY